jgi:hypothetical protein
MRPTRYVPRAQPCHLQPTVLIQDCRIVLFFTSLLVPDPKPTTHYSEPEISPLPGLSGWHSIFAPDRSTVFIIWPVLWYGYHADHEKLHRSMTVVVFTSGNEVPDVDLRCGSGSHLWIRRERNDMVKRGSALYRRHMFRGVCMS